jgi:hypothetical protein
MLQPREQRPQTLKAGVAFGHVSPTLPERARKDAKLSHPV